MTPVGAVSNRTASAQLETAPTKHGEQKCLFIFMIHHKKRAARYYGITPDTEPRVFFVWGSVRKE